MSYQSHLRHDIKEVAGALEDPITWAKSKGFTGTDEYLLGAFKGWMKQLIAGLQVTADLAIHEAKVDAKLEGYLEAVKDAKEIKEASAEDWQGAVHELVADCCFVQMHYGRFGVGCSLTDPDLPSVINVARKDTETEAIQEAIRLRNMRKTAVAA